MLAHVGSVQCQIAQEDWVTLPVFAGILKHPHSSDLPSLLQKPEVARKYTKLALEKAAWPILREFPKEWLILSVWIWRN